MKRIFFLFLITLSGCASQKPLEGTTTTSKTDSLPDSTLINAPFEQPYSSSDAIEIDVDSLCREYYAGQLHDTVYVSSPPVPGKIISSVQLKRIENKFKLTFEAERKAYQDTIRDLRVRFNRPVTTIHSETVKYIPVKTGWQQFLNYWFYVSLGLLALVFIVLIKKKA